MQTEYEGQAKKYMDVVDPSDAIITVGGDGTLSEVTFVVITCEFNYAVEIGHVSFCVRNFTVTVSAAQTFQTKHNYKKLLLSSECSLYNYSDIDSHIHSIGVL